MDWPDELLDLREITERIDKIQTEAVKFEDSTVGKIQAELEEARNDVREYHAKQEADRAIEKSDLLHEKVRDRRITLVFGLICAAFGSALTLLLDHICEIVDFFASLFH